VLARTHLINALKPVRPRSHIISVLPVIRELRDRFPEADISIRVA
jgi:hypothetical protein